MIVIQAINVSKALAGQDVLRNVYLALQEGEKAGLVGLNGCGKTTLLKCLAGMMDPDQGMVTVENNQTVGSLEQIPDRNPADTVWDAMMSGYTPLLSLRAEMERLETMMAAHGDNTALEKYAGLQEAYDRQNGYACETMARRILSGLGFSPDQYSNIMGTLSGGQKTRLDLARLLATSPSIMLLDEPTNHLDISAVEWLEDYLRAYHGSVLVVSHDRRFLDRVVNKVFQLRSGQLKSYEGNYSIYVNKTLAEDEAYARAYAKQQEQIKRVESYIDRYRAGIKSRQARGRQSQLERLERLARPSGETIRERWKISMEQPSGQEVIRLAGIQKQFDGNVLFSNLELTVRQGEHIGLIGPNGCGKSTLLKILIGRTVPDQGEVVTGSRVKIAYFSQEYEGLQEEHTLLESMIYGCGLTVQLARDLLGRMNFRGDKVDQPIHVLSGGEKGRLAILQLLCSGANLLVLDEPTNHLDIGGRQAVEAMLLDYPGTLVVVSHDRYFLDQVTDRILVLDQQAIHSYPGNYTYYLEKAGLRPADVCEAATYDVSNQQQFRMQQKEGERRKRRLERDIRELEAALQVLEERRTTLLGQLEDPSCYQDMALSLKTNREYELVEIDIDKTYHQWIEAQEAWERFQEEWRRQD